MEIGVSACERLRALFSQIILHIVHGLLLGAVFYREITKLYRVEFLRLGLSVGDIDYKKIRLHLGDRFILTNDLRQLIILVDRRSQSHFFPAFRLLKHVITL